MSNIPPASLNLTGALIENLNFGTARTSNVTHSSNVATGDYANFTVNNNGVAANIQQAEAVPEECYSMKNSPRGRCLIISNKRFEKTEKIRKGTEHDVENLEETFKWLEFDVEVKEDCKAEDIKQYMEEYSTMNHEKFECFVCCILSHGGSKGISGTDGKFVSMEDIQKGFKECKTLAGKPKLFFIQACRGEVEDNGVMPEADYDLPSEDQPSAPVEKGQCRSRSGSILSVKPLTANDFTLAYATPPGYLAWRSTKTGSWFISSLCDVLQEQASGTDLMVMLTEVSQRVSSMATRKASLEEAEEAVKQCLEKSTTLTKKLYFNPSKTFEEYQDD